MDNFQFKDLFFDFLTNKPNFYQSLHMLNIISRKDIFIMPI